MQYEQKGKRMINHIYFLVYGKKQSQLVEQIRYFYLQKKQIMV